MRVKNPRHVRKKRVYHRLKSPVKDPDVVRLYRQVIRTIQDYEVEEGKKLKVREIDGLRKELHNFVYKLQRMYRKYLRPTHNKLLCLRWDLIGNSWQWHKTPDVDCFTLSVGTTGYGTGNHAFATKYYPLLCLIAQDLFGIIAHIMKDTYNKLWLYGFKRDADSPTNDYSSPTIEDVFAAFSKVGHWKTSLMEVNIEECDENAVGDSFEMCGGAYPEHLQQVVFHDEYTHDIILSSTIFKLASKSSQFEGVFRMPPMSIMDDTTLPHTTLSPGAFQCLLDIMKNSHTLCMGKEDYLWNGRTKEEEELIWNAITTGHSHPPVTKYDSMEERNLLFQFYQKCNRYRSHIVVHPNNTISKSLAPFIIEHCLNKSNPPKGIKEIDLLFYLVRERVDWLLPQS